MVSSYQDKLNSLGAALERLKEVLDACVKDGNAMLRDAAIKRFEFSFELFWKVMKAYLIGQGYDVRSPREVLQQAFAIGLLPDETVWLTMLSDRNLAAHLYSELVATEIFEHIKEYYLSLKISYETLLKANSSF